MSFSLFGAGNKIKQALRRGAVIIDVRAANEFDQGKVSDSINIPVDRLSINLERLRGMKTPLIICSNSHSDNETAISFLKANGVKEVYNGGSWTKLWRLVKSM